MRVETLDPMRVTIDLADTGLQIFDGCPEAVDAYMSGDFITAADALAEAGQEQPAHAVRAMWHRTQGDRAAEARELAAAGQMVQSAEIAAEMDPVAAAEMFEHPVFARVLGRVGQVVEVEQLQRVSLAGVPAWVALDVVVRLPGESCTVVDWKTGKNHEESLVDRQLAVYGLYVREAYDLSPFEAIAVIHADLRGNTYRTIWPDEDQFGEASREIQASFARISELEASFRADPDLEGMFPMLPDGATACAACRFRGSCGRT